MARKTIKSDKLMRMEKMLSTTLFEMIKNTEHQSTTKLDLLDFRRDEQF